MTPSRRLPDADLVSRCRAVLRPGAFCLLPQANRVSSVLPGFSGAVAQVLAAPPMGARFVQHELLIEPGGGTAGPVREPLEQFLYVLEGSLSLTFGGEGHLLQPGGFAWLPPDEAWSLRNGAGTAGRAVWLRRPYRTLAGMPTPVPIVAAEQAVPAVPEDTYREQQLLPFQEQIAFDMAVNVLNFDPGVQFGFVEAHIMEHGLYMLAGRGVYWLNGEYLEVQAGDFIYMAPYCPQFFYATGWEPSRYLIYKDVNRDYTHGL